jgi:hypothetical protein
VTLQRGQELQVTLDSTYWTLSVSPSTGTLAVVSQDVTPGGPGCTHAVEGSGCGTARLVLRAVAEGRATVLGQRSSCGEALRCGPAEGSYRLEGVVSG